MSTRRLLYFFLTALTLQCLGCGGSSGSGMSGGEHDQVMGEATELALKILTEAESGKDVKEVNAAFEKQVTELDARIAKLTPLKLEQTQELIRKHGSKFRQIDEKNSVIILKGPLPKLPDYTLYNEATINPVK